METIDPNKPIVIITEPSQAESQSKVKKGEFDAIFRQTVDSTKVTRPKTESAPFLCDIRPAQFSTESLPSETMLVERVQRLIDTMGAYQQKLIDSGATLKTIQSLVRQMAAENESLGAASTAVQGPKRLQTIVDQSMTLASMEIAKFNSGYYNDG